ncbi:phage baseplate plug family protein [Ursidibacter arcticus]
MVYEIPLKPVPNQHLTCTIAGQKLDITLNTRLDNALYISVKSDDKPIIFNRVCQNATPLVDVNYSSFKGVLFFVDTQGNRDPNYKQLGTRYRLIWGQ